MKEILTSLSFLSCAFISVQGQSSLANASFRIRILDAETGKDVPKANIYVNEIRGLDKLSDDDGVVVYELPTDRHCIINIRKDGYVATSIEVQASATSNAPNFKEVRLEKEYYANKVILYGWVGDRNEKDIPNAEVVVSFQGQSASAKTDSFGNYRFEIPQSKFKTVRSFSIEVKIPDCDNCRTDEDFNGNTLIKRDFKIGLSPYTRITDQNLSGNWTGTVTMVGFGSDFNATLQINAEHGRITGTLRLAVVADVRYFARFNVEGTYTDENVTLNEISVIEYGIGPMFCFKQYPGRMTQDGTGLTLSGKWNNDDHRFFESGKTVVESGNFSCAGGTFTLKKIGQ